LYSIGEGKAVFENPKVNESRTKMILKLSGEGTIWEKEAIIRKQENQSKRRKNAWRPGGCVLENRSLNGNLREEKRKNRIEICGGREAKSF